MRLAQNFRFAFDFTLSTQDWTSMLGLLCWFDHGEGNHPFSFSSLGIGLCTLYGPHICTLEACLSGCAAFARLGHTRLNQIRVLSGSQDDPPNLFTVPHQPS